VTRIGMLHTSFVFINRETMLLDLFSELLPDAQLVHFVDSEVLDAVVAEGRISEASVGRMRHLALAAQEADVQVIFSACSSLGPAIELIRDDVDVPIVRVDEAMARRAVAQAERIGVLATVPSTLGPTADLIQQEATRAGREVEIVPQLAEGGFDALMAGDRDRHDDIVVQAARTLAERCQVIVLAQASMARMEARLSEETGLEVLSSPRLGVESVSEVLTGLK
jgi:Asp/Glu/hydantoin racemase